MSRRRETKSNSRLQVYCLLSMQMIKLNKANPKIENNDYDADII